MTKAEAHMILDAARAGEDKSKAEITRALIETGDYEDDTVQVIRPVGTWERLTAQHIAPAGFWDGLVA